MNRRADFMNTDTMNNDTMKIDTVNTDSRRFSYSFGKWYYNRHAFRHTVEIAAVRLHLAAVLAVRGAHEARYAVLDCQIWALEVIGEPLLTVGEAERPRVGVRLRGVLPIEPVA